MKKIFKNIMTGLVGLYLISLTLITPYYNYQYAKEHGFINWLIFGEIVATIKSAVWPYYAFFSDEDSFAGHPDEHHYANSKKASDEALKIVVKSGDITRLSVENRNKAADLLGLAITEANQVQSGYLQKVHPEFSAIYEKNYIHSISLLIEGLRTNNTRVTLEGAFGYNEFAKWMQSHEKDLSF
ncbi:MAG: hypothetical protein M0036_01830 [Desulfobacteraceae bacterium]|nr:hypothetical protein [Desulfobacteraceae bacterium]